jgi:PPOX class probable F420-dependent enzyme
MDAVEAHRIRSYRPPPPPYTLGAVTSGPRAEPFSAPASYGVDNNPGELLPWPEVEGWLERARSYWVTTVRGDGRPHAMPVWGAWIDGAVWFSTHPDSVKGRNIARDPRIIVHLESGDDAAILEGTAERPGPDDPLARFVDVYEDKYGYRIEVGERSMGIFLLRPRLAFAWRERDYPRSATRWAFD